MKELIKIKETTFENPSEFFNLLILYIDEYNLLKEIK
jgi:hypothetical protein